MRLSPLVLLLLASLAVACGTEDGDKDAGATDDVGVDATADTGAAGDTGAADAGPKLTLKWTELVPDATAKIRAAAAVPGKPGSYVLVGEKATVLQLDGATFTDISPTNVGKADLNAVWVSKDGQVVAAGEGSTLITWDSAGDKGGGWQVAGAVPPTPVVTFLAIDGRDGGDVWAVGEKGEAWRRTAGVWAPAAVTTTSGEAAADGADFLDVAVTDDGGVWIAASKGATAEGVVLRSDDGKTFAGVATTSSPRALWVDPSPGGAAKDGGALVVGGTTEAYVARFDGKAFVGAGDVKWSLGFRSVGGVAPDDLFIGGLKGQLRRWDGKAWSVVEVAPPPGTVSGFPQPSGDLLAIAHAEADEVLVVTSFKHYRFGEQP